MYLWKEMVDSQQSELDQEGRNAVVVVDNPLPTTGTTGGKGLEELLVPWGSC